MATSGGDSLVIWARSSDPSPTESHVVLWQAFLPEGAPPGWTSLPSQVARRDADLRARTLRWLHDVGTVLAPRLHIRPHLSAWWLGLPAAFPFEPDAPVYTIARLMVLLEFLDERANPGRIRLACDDPGLTRLLRASLRRAGYATAVEPTGPATRQRSPRELLSAAVARWAPLAGLRIVIGHLRCTSRSEPADFAGTGPLIIDYLAHLPESATRTGVFASNYWGVLVDVLEAQEPPPRWLHLSGRQASPHVLGSDRRLVAAFNRAGSGRHALVHDWLTRGALAGSLRDWIVQFGLWLRVRHTVLPGPPAFHPIVRASVRDGLIGKQGALNVIWLRCFERLVPQVKGGSFSAYLMENQPWEMALLATWQAAAPEPIVGVIHSSVTPWNTRAFKDPRDLFQSGVDAMPWPTVIAINGDLARQHFLAAGFPAERLADVEALRYLEITPATQHWTLPSAGQPPRLLVLGEYGGQATASLLAIVASALELLSHDPGWPRPDVHFRPHPAGDPVDIPRSVRCCEGRALDAGTASDHGSADPAHRTMGEALAWADIAICGPLSTVILEALCMGRPTVIVDDPAVIDGNPAAGLPGAQHAASAAALAEQLSTLWADRCRGDGAVLPDPQSVFFLDARIPRWRQLLTGISNRTASPPTPGT